VRHFDDPRVVAPKDFRITFGLDIEFNELESLGPRLTIAVAVISQIVHFGAQFEYR
jgi:hypothetical protein